MDTSGYVNVLELEQQHRVPEAGALLRRLVASNDPLALIEFGTRCRLEPNEAPQMYMPGKNAAAADECITKGIRILQSMADSDDGEAMRHLAYVLLGHYGLEYRDIDLAEHWLLKAFSAGHFFAANDLISFYQESDTTKAKHWYAEAERHGCRVVFNSCYET